MTGYLRPVLAYFSIDIGGFAAVVLLAPSSSISLARYYLVAKLVATTACSRAREEEVAFTILPLTRRNAVQIQFCGLRRLRLSLQANPEFKDTFMKKRVSTHLKKCRFFHMISCRPHF